MFHALIATSLDANSWLCPLAFAIYEKENGSNWWWFQQRKSKVIYFWKFLIHL